MFEVLKVIEWNKIINILFIINVIDFKFEIINVKVNMKLSLNNYIKDVCV
jgi:hypothetical protein